jgi:UDP-GlcNAc:undecaprenyl-phosphate GlcNAc-1-phosphate transferase
MTTLIGIFILALCLGLVLTPGVRWLALANAWFDRASDRKVHQGNIPRIGGAAIFLSFFVSLALAWLYPTHITRLMTSSPELAGIAAGALLLFLLGLRDDIRGVNPYFKLAVQIGVAAFTWAAGIQIDSVTAGSEYGIQLGWLSFPVTIFWFLLVINAINLIDGLDGLAAGVSLFATIVLLIVCLVMERFQAAIGFAALGGATLGFLRYNFNPAMIFMGDSGSYFLGYMLAALSILGSVKSTASVALLIPVVALGIPLIDSLIAPLRRFVRGRQIFMPDNDHLHHRLLRMGMKHRTAVLMLYGATIVMGLVAVMMVYATNEQIALILLLLGGLVFVAFRKLGYLEYLAFDKIYGWVRDVTDEAGISHDRRSFLNLQMEMASSRDLPTLWGHVTQALDRLGFDFAEIDLKMNGESQNACSRPTEHGISTFADGQNGHAYRWQRNSGYHFETACAENLLKLELPLLDNGSRSLGHMRLVKDLNREAISHYTLRRVEHLRRSVMGTLRNLI